MIWIKPTMDIQWIGLEDNLQENPMMLMGKPMNIYGIRLRCAFKPIH